MENKDLKPNRPGYMPAHPCDMSMGIDIISCTTEAQIIPSTIGPEALPTPVILKQVATIK